MSSAGFAPDAGSIVSLPVKTEASLPSFFLSMLIFYAISVPMLQTYPRVSSNMIQVSSLFEVSIYLFVSIINHDYLSFALHPILFNHFCCHLS